MGIPRFEPEALPFRVTGEALRYPLQIDSENLTIGAVSIGNPHAVLQVENIEHAPVTKLGPLIERHPHFPEYVNVGFMQVLATDHIRLRVYERGAGETLACGSGACAAVVIGHRWGILGSTVRVDLPGGYTPDPVAGRRGTSVDDRPCRASIYRNNRAVNKNKPVIPVNERDITDYLRAHPEFFQRHDYLLEELKFPHPESGHVLSLLEHQVNILRAQRRDLKREIERLGAMARDNQVVLERLQTFILGLLPSSNLPDIRQRIEKRLTEDFEATAVNLLLFGDIPGCTPLDEATARSLSEVLHKHQPICGHLRKAQATTLFGEQAADIASAILVPLCTDERRCLGLLAIGSHHADRFHPSMATNFISHLGDVLGQIVGRHLAPS